MSLEDLRYELERCSQCFYCTFVPHDQMKSWRFSKGCPSIGHGEFMAYAARGRYNLGLALLQGRCGYSDAVKDMVYRCTTCGSCDVACKVCRYNLHVVNMLHELRAKLVKDGQTLPAHEESIAKLRKGLALAPNPNPDRAKWAEGLPVKRLNKEKAEVVFHAGCRYTFDQGLQPRARTAVSLLAKAGVDFGILEAHETCCGSRAYTTGYQEDSQKAAERLMESWAKAGVKTVVTSCADGYWAFKRLYPQWGSQFEVLHTVEYLDRLIKGGALKPTRKVPLTVTYHDPCHLGRQGEPYVPWEGEEKKVLNQVIVYEPRRPRYNGAWGVYEPPRDVLKSIPGVTLVEMQRIREYAWCCGAGGGAREAYPEFSAWTASERIEEANTTGAEAIVTACPWCERNFMDAIAKSGGKMKVLDVAELVQMAL